jgi:NADPH-dependent 2,4-dienoyl-CoA reductase/sulfur reductase-like enzyme
VRETDITILGAGPAGLTAARAAAESGASVWLLDDNALPGGQYFRQLPPGFKRTRETAFDKEHARAAALFEAARHPNVTYLPGATVWDAPEAGVLAFARGADSGRVRARATILAVGAYDRPVPFPGWTLPGVVTAGGLQNLVKGARVIPGGRAVVAGNGPLLLVVAANLLRAGARLEAVLEAAPSRRRVLAQLPRLLQAPGIVRQAVTYNTLMRRAGTPLHTGWTVVEARGADALEEVVAAPIDAAGRIDRAASRTFAADTLVTGFGLNPSIEMYRLLGCRLSYNRVRGGWLPVRSGDLETSVAGVFAAGDGAGIGGIEMALAEGRLAGIVAAERTGHLDAAAARRAARPARGRIARFARFREGLERVYAPPASYLPLLTPETVVCRCEEVTLAEVREREAQGFTSPFAIKGSTRMTMGRCQGRNCLPTLAALVADGAGGDASTVELPRARPPARPVTIADLMHEDLPDPVFPEDPHLPRGEEVR